MGEPILVILMLFTGLYIFARVAELAEKTKTNQLREEVVREVLRKAKQKQKIDELYGRGAQDEDR